MTALRTLRPEPWTSPVHATAPTEEAGWESARLAAQGWTLQSEGEQWSAQRQQPGGVDVVVFEGEAAARAWVAGYGGELKRRRRVTYVGPWESGEPEPQPGIEVSG